MQEYARDGEDLQLGATTKVRDTRLTFRIQKVERNLQQQQQQNNDAYHVYRDGRQINKDLRDEAEKERARKSLKHGGKLIPALSAPSGGT